MRPNDIKKIIADCINTITFKYNGENCGVDPEVNHYEPTYTMWYGKKWKDFFNVDDLLAEKFFDGKSLLDICDKLDINFS